MRRWLMVLCVLAGCSGAATDGSQQAFVRLGGPGATCYGTRGCNSGLFCAPPDDQAKYLPYPGTCTATGSGGTVIWCLEGDPRGCPTGMVCGPSSESNGGDQPDGGVDLQAKGAPMDNPDPF